MTDTSSAGSRRLYAGVARAVLNAWSTVRTVYYANSVSWRALKSGGLLFFGFFLWAGSSVLQSYTGWRALDYTAAYGFVVLWYGPIHHIVVIPLALRWRRSAGLRQRVGRRLPNAMLAVFLVVVLFLGTFPAGPMTVNFDSAIGGADAADVNAELVCESQATAETTRISCELRDAEQVDRVVVVSGGTELVTDDDPPYEFTVDAGDVEETMGRQAFTVRLYDESGNLARQYTRDLQYID